MFTVKLDWHAHNLDLDAVQTYVKANFPHCVGSSADYCLTFWFTEALSTGQEQNLRSYWAALGDVSPEAQSYTPAVVIQERMEDLKVDAVTKTWDQLSTVQRKLIVGQSVTKQELGFA